MVPTALTPPAVRGGLRDGAPQPARTHPLWRPYTRPTDEEIAAARVGVPPLPARVDVVAPDEEWPRQYATFASSVQAALGRRVLGLEHVGSTSVPGLWAKPVIDIDLLVADPADEPSYVPALEQCGFTLRIREPEWEQHRCLVHESPRCNVHVFAPGALEPRRHLAFRRWLAENPDDRERYAAIKRAIAQRGVAASTMHYNNEKAALIYDIYERIFAADPEHRHDPRPR